MQRGAGCRIEGVSQRLFTLQKAFECSANNIKQQQQQQQQWTTNNAQIGHATLVARTFGCTHLPGDLIEVCLYALTSTEGSILVL